MATTLVIDDASEDPATQTSATDPINNPFGEQYVNQIVNYNEYIHRLERTISIANDGDDTKLSDSYKFGDNESKLKTQNDQKKYREFLLQ